MKKFACYILILFLISCVHTEETLPSDVFEVTTRGISIDCRLVIIEFQESDRKRIERLTEHTGLHYEALNLDRITFEAENQKLNVRVRKILDSENMACTTLGVRFPMITVLSAGLVD